MDTSLDSLLGDGSTATGTSLPSFGLPSGFTTLFTVFMVVTSVASLIILVLYIMNMITTYRAHKAAIESRDILREMNERDKARSLTTATTPSHYDATASAPSSASSDIS